MNNTAAKSAVPLASSATESASPMVAPTHPVVVSVAQGYEHAINIRIVPADIAQFKPYVFGCQPRHGATRRDAEPVPLLPPSLIDKLGAANRAVVAWLAQAPANATLFLAQPVEALGRAGVQLTRTEQKLLGRLHQAATDTRSVAPGVTITKLAVTANAKGRVPDPEQVRRSRPAREKDCDCEGKE